ncbi:LysR substrate-binding domain-containing protein [Ensifer adhaerens]|uniref:LysR substrate-binding domain-containing protein n=1 Tax=Ensifer adhaerens TaxID=106592 RepID=UPI0023A97E9F|nr:LysR substrate-binding domain-containing protein [Ensifer adhaerens]WDZ76229.1 LysR substrate-binding domain-containing protein [Ensifer adhaerens]
MSSRRKLPPLNAIRTFEAAGRHQNFSKAAEELNVTPGAVSRQVKVLEEHLGISLFVRTPVDVRITRQGQLYLLSVQESLARLEASTQEIVVQTLAQPLRIWGSRFFIHLWLVPHLSRYFREYPDQEVEITSLLSSEPMPPEVDVGFRFGNGIWPGMRSHFLLGLNLTPVCSPDYLANSAPLRTPEDLSAHPLLHNIVGSDHWRLWYEASGAEPRELKRRIVCTSADVAYKSAVEGLGVALGRRGFIERDLATGRLVMPIDFTMQAEGAFYLVYHDRDPLPGRLLQFRRWILNEIARSQGELQG